MAKGWPPVRLGLLVWITLLAPATAQGPSRKLQHGVTPADSTSWGGHSRKLQEGLVPEIPEPEVR